MPKRFISKYLPHANTVTGHRSLRWLGPLLHNSNLWHLNRRSVATAVFAGVFAGFLPIPMQMLLAASIAIYLHGNLPLSIALTWISNPLTYAPFFYLCYRFGLLLLGEDYNPSEMEWNLEVMIENVALPLAVGCIVGGIISGTLGYLAVRVLWRLHIQHQWIKRKSLRAKQIGQAVRNKARSLSSEMSCSKEQNNMQSPAQNNVQTDVRTDLQTDTQKSPSKAADTDPAQNSK